MQTPDLTDLFGHMGSGLFRLPPKARHFVQHLTCEMVLWLDRLMSRVLFPSASLCVAALLFSSCSEVNQGCPSGQELTADGTDCRPIPCLGGELEGNQCVCPAGQVLDRGRCLDSDDPCIGVQCNDANPCTDDVCIDAFCSFEASADGTACDAGGTAGLCVSGSCEDDPCALVNCVDRNECTVDGECNPANAMCEGGRDESDGLACSFGDSSGVCESGACVDAMLCADVDCNDDDPCTEDLCDLATGNCSNKPLEENAECEVEGVRGECIAQVCVGLCEDAATKCNDNNACTTDSCDPETGCINTSKNCSDGNPCTEDGCNTANGTCLHTNEPDGTGCTVPCTPPPCFGQFGSCSSGTCRPLGIGF